MSHPQSIFVPVSPAELLDRITILQIKRERIDDDAKCENVKRELALLADVRAQHIASSDDLLQLTSDLKKVNEALWQIEDDIRRCEHDQDFGPQFIELARSVYFNNDRRYRLKVAINEMLGSELIEQKSYADYT